MTRRTELLAALAKGDASAMQLLDMMAPLGWTKQLVKTRLSNAIRGEWVWVSDKGNYGWSSEIKSPRMYTSDRSRALAEAPTRKAKPKNPNKPLNKTTAVALTASAIKRRSDLEAVWADMKGTTMDAKNNKELRDMQPRATKAAKSKFAVQKAPSGVPAGYFTALMKAPSEANEDGWPPQFQSRISTVQRSI